MIVSPHLLCLALLTCCRAAATASDGDASTPALDRPEEIDAPDTGFVDYDAPAPIPDRSKEMPPPDSGFVNQDASAPHLDPSEEMHSLDSGFRYLKTDDYCALIEKLRELPLPNKKLLPHLTEKFVTLRELNENYPARFREAHIGADKDLMNGVKLYRSAQPWTSKKPQTQFGYLSMSGSVVQTELPLYDISFLQEHSVKNIINLNPLKFSPDSQLLLKNTGIHVEHIPILDFLAPTSQQIRQAITSIENARKSNECTWVFCGYGDGRTGTIVAAYEVWMIFQAYPDLSSIELRTYVMRRSGYIKVARGIFDEATIQTLINAYDTHKIEKDKQFDALLTFADEISTTCVVNK